MRGPLLSWQGSFFSVRKNLLIAYNSGVPVKEWCREQRISYSTYYRHEQALLKSAQDPSGTPISEQMHKSVQ